MLSRKANHINSFQIFQVLKYSGQVLINILLAKTTLSTNDLGRFEFFLFIASSISFFWVTGIMQGLLSIYPKSIKTKPKESSLLFNSAILLLSISTLALLIILFFLEYSNANLDINQKNLLLIYLLINPVGFLSEYILLLKKKFKELIAFGIVTFLTPCLLISLPAFSGLDLNFSFYGLISWALLKLLYTSKLISQNSNLAINRKEIMSLLINALPLIGTALLVGSAAYIDRLHRCARGF